MKRYLLALILLVVCTSRPVHAEISNLKEGVTTSSQPVELSSRDILLDSIHDPVVKQKALKLLGDHKELLARLKTESPDVLLEQGVIKNLRHKTSTPRFEVASERGAEVTTVTLFQSNILSLGRPDIELNIHRQSGQLRLLIHRMADGTGRVVLWNEKGEIIKNEIVKESKDDGTLKDRQIIWPTLPETLDASGAGDQKVRVEETFALIGEVLSRIKAMQKVAQYKASVVSLYYGYLDGWGNIAKISFAVQKNTNQLFTITLKLSDSEDHTLAVQFNPLSVMERKGRIAVWSFKCDQNGKVTYINKKP